MSEGGSSQSRLAPQRARRWAWVVAVLYFGIGDLGTTSLGLAMAGVSEMHPFAAPLLEVYGHGVLLGLKVVVLGGGFLLWKLVPRPICDGVPVGLALLGLAVTVWNLHLIFVVFFG